MTIKSTNRVILSAWIVLAVFFIIHCSTTAGEQWIWNLHKTKLVQLPGENIFDSLAHGQIKIEPLPQYTALHEFELAVIATAILCMLNRRSPKLRQLLDKSRRWAPSLCGMALILPLIYVPSTCTIKEGRYPEKISNYEWIWDVGSCKIELTSVVLEELVVMVAIGIGFRQVRVVGQRQA